MPGAAAREWEASSGIHGIGHAWQEGRKSPERLSRFRERKAIPEAYLAEKSPIKKKKWDSFFSA